MAQTAPRNNPKKEFLARFLPGASVGGGPAKRASRAKNGWVVEVVGARACFRGGSVLSGRDVSGSWLSHSRRSTLSYFLVTAQPAVTRSRLGRPLVVPQQGP